MDMKPFRGKFRYILLLGVIVFSALFLIKNNVEQSLSEPVGQGALFEEKAEYVRVGEENHNIRYVSAGQGEQTLILIHGLGATAYTWRHLIDLLAEEYRVYALDLIGFGMSDKPDAKPSPRFFADFMVDFMDAVGADQAHLIGNSLGGAVAAATALWHPERVQTIGLIGAGGYDDLMAHRPFFVRLAGYPVIGEGIILLSQISPRGIVRSTLEESAYDPDFIDDDIVHEFARAFVTPNYRRFVLRFIREFYYEDLEKGIPEISHPALILWGAEDEWIPVAFAHRFHADLPDSKLVIFEECGHEPQEEQPERTADVIRSFIEDSL